MDLLPPSQPRRPPNASPVTLPSELIAEVISFLPVKSLMQLRSVCKSWKSIIDDPTFVKLHLNRSSQKPDLTFVTSAGITIWTLESTGTVSFTVCHLSENPPVIINLPDDDPYYQLKDKDCAYIIGSCNGMLCLLGLNINNFCGYMDISIRFWNPASRKLSKKLGYCGDGVNNNPSWFPGKGDIVKFVFGYVNSSDTYKVVYFTVGTTIVRVFSLGDNIWRKIENSPVDTHHVSGFVHLSGSVFWVTIQNYNGYDDYVSGDFTIEQFVVMSLDLGTEKYTQLRPPQGFDQVPFLMPKLSVLEDCLCFSHDFEQTHFVIWQMKEFGVEESWTRFLKISYHNLQIDIDDRFDDMSLYWVPLCVSEKSGTLLLTNRHECQTILFNWRDNKVQRIHGHWLSKGKEYVESLVSYC